MAHGAKEKAVKKIIFHADRGKKKTRKGIILKCAVIGTGALQLTQKNHERKATMKRRERTLKITTPTTAAGCGGIEPGKITMSNS